MIQVEQNPVQTKRSLTGYKHARKARTQSSQIPAVTMTTPSVYSLEETATNPSKQPPTQKVPNLDVPSLATRAMIQFLHNKGQTMPIQVVPPLAMTEKTQGRRKPKLKETLQFACLQRLTENCQYELWNAETEKSQAAQSAEEIALSLRALHHAKIEKTLGLHSSKLIARIQDGLRPSRKETSRN